MKATKFFYVLILITSLFAFLSCQSIEKKLANSWIPVPLPNDIFYSGKVEIVNLTGDQLDEMMTPISFIDFQSDGKYSSYFYKYNHGTWEKKEDYLFLKQSTGKVDTILFKSISNDTLTLGFKEKDSYRYFKFTGFENSDDPSENPFLVENNKWRIESKTNETKDQIKNRILNHIRYYKLYFKLAVDKKIYKIDARTLPSPIEITQYGISPNSDPTFNEWKFYFKTTDNYQLACKMIESHLNVNRYIVGNGTGDKQLFDLFENFEKGFTKDPLNL